MTAGEWGLLIALAILWGAAFYFVAIAVHDIPPLTLGAIRLLLGGSLLVTILYATGGRLPLDGRSLRWFALVAFVNSLVPIFLIGWAQQYIGAGLTAILNGAMPLWTLFVAHMLTREEKLTGLKLLGTVIGFGGVTLMVGLDALKGLDRNVLAQLAAVLATIFFAFGNVAGRHFRALGVPPLAATAGTLMASGLMFLPLALVFDQPWNRAMPGASALAAAVAAGLLSTALAHFLFFRLLSTAGATNASLVTLISVPVAVIMGTFLLGEVLEWRHLAGMIAVAIGLAIVDGRPWRRARRQFGV